MDCKNILELLKSIRSLSRDGIEEISSGNSNGLRDTLDLIESDIAHIRIELDA